MQKVFVLSFFPLGYKLERNPCRVQFASLANSCANAAQFCLGTRICVQTESQDGLSWE